MNREWSELNKTMQAQIKKKDTYETGIDTLLRLRSQLMQTLVSFREFSLPNSNASSHAAFCHMRLHG